MTEQSHPLQALIDAPLADALRIKIAEYLGLRRSVQTGTDDQGKPTFTQILDVERVEAQLAWRRKAA